MAGQPLRLTVRSNGTWTARLRDRKPTPDEAEYLAGPYTSELADHVLYPAGPVAVGAEWDVALDVIEARWGPLDTGVDNAYRVRLDSVGVLDGRPVAFLSHSGTYTHLRSGGPTLVETLRRSVVDLATRVEVAIESSGTRTFEWESGPEDGPRRTTRWRTWQDARTERRVVPEGEAP